MITPTRDMNLTDIQYSIQRNIGMMLLRERSIKTIGDLENALKEDPKVLNKIRGFGRLCRLEIATNATIGAVIPDGLLEAIDAHNSMRDTENDSCSIPTTEQTETVEPPVNQDNTNIKKPENQIYNKYEKDHVTITLSLIEIEMLQTILSDSIKNGQATSVRQSILNKLSLYEETNQVQQVHNNAKQVEASQNGNTEETESPTIIGWSERIFDFINDGLFHSGESIKSAISDYIEQYTVNSSMLIVAFKERYIDNDYPLGNRTNYTLVKKNSSIHAFRKDNNTI